MINAIQALVDQGCRGELIEPAKLLDELNKFDIIVLRGAGSFGQALGKRFIKFDGLKPKLIYWDQRAAELVSVHGIDVCIPYSSEFDKSKTLAINCIPGGSAIGGPISSELKKYGFNNVLYGMSLFETLVCPLNNKVGFNSSVCLEQTACTWCNCRLLMNLLKNSPNSNRGHFEDDLAIQVQTFVINTKCTLKCKHCSYLLNCYAEEDKINFPLERIKKDMDKFFDAVDTVAFVSLIGGEPFLHPDLNEIVEHNLTKSNFGMIGITTNGICRISKDNLRVLNNPRTRVIFSHYTHALSEQQESIFQANVKKVRSAGINYSLGEPMWYLPPSLTDQNYSHKQLLKKKAGCSSSFTSRIVMNGRYFPCSVCMNAHGLEVCDTLEDSIDLSRDMSKHELREKIIAVTRKESYVTCNYCGHRLGESSLKLPFSGEQGFDKRYDHLMK